MNKLDKLFIDMIVSNKIGHAFLIGNTQLKNIMEELNLILSNYIFKEEIDLLNSPDIYIINPKGSIINKEQILELQEKLKTTSQIHDKKVYIINECEKMNSFAYNSLLKFLEEPQRDIYAFLITSNINNIIQTIKSRCQIIFLSNEQIDQNIYQLFDENFINNVFEVINILETNKEKAIAYLPDILSKEKDKDFYKNMLLAMELFYRDCLNIKLNKNSEYFVNDEVIVNKIAKLGTIESITNKILLFNNKINEIDYNLNLNLLIDKIIIEFGRC